MKISYSTMGSAYSDFRPSIGVNGRAVDDLQIKRLHDMEEGLQRLQSMPSANQISRQASMDRMGWLRQLLDAMKMMLLHASPEQAKALALALKSIAGELASIAKGLGSDSSGRALPHETEVVDVPPNGQTSVQSTTEDLRPEATVAEPHSTKTVEAVGNGSDATPVNQGERKPNSPVGTAGESSRKNSGKNSPPQEVDDAVLRGLLLDVKKLLKEVVDMLKSKLAATGKETKEDMRAIEKSMSEIDSALQQGPASNSYSDQGSLVLGFGSLTVSGLNINLTA